MNRFAANLSTMFCEMPLADRFAAAARAGFRVVELQFPYAMRADDLTMAVRRAGLKLVLINAPAGDPNNAELGLACEGGGRFEQAICQAQDYAVRAGCRLVHVLVGKALGGFGIQQRRMAARNLRWAADRFARDGITLLLEPLNPIDRHGYALPTLADAEALRREIGAANVQLQFDAYHAARIGADPIALWAEYRRVTGHVQIAAGPDRGEPDTQQMRDFLDVLLACDYDGFIGCEYIPRRNTLAGLGWMSRYVAGSNHGPTRPASHDLDIGT